MFILRHFRAKGLNKFTIILMRTDGNPDMIVPEGFKTAAGSYQDSIFFKEL